METDKTLVPREVTKTSSISGTTRTRTFSATSEQWQAYDNGELIQYALPHLSDGDREFLMTGITDEEWDEAFPEDDEDPEGIPARPDSR